MATLSAFHGIELGRKSLNAHQTALSVVGHNLSNLNTEGYSRQIIDLETWIPLYPPDLTREATAGQIGTGVVPQSIRRVRDAFIDSRITFENGGLGFWKARHNFLHQIEMIYNEPNTPNLRTAIEKFWEAWQKVAMDPTERAARRELLQRAELLTSTVRHTFNSLYDLRKNAELLLHDRINEINHIAEEIAKLNAQIRKSEALGDNPNDLYDRRDLLVEKLSKLVDVKVHRDGKEFIVYIGSDHLVQGEHYERLALVENRQNEGFSDVVWEKDGRRVKIEGGEVLGLITARDVDIFTEIQRIDALASNLMDLTNEIHRSGFGLNGRTGVDFFTWHNLSPYANGDYDFNGDGILESTAVFKVSGTQKLSPETVVNYSGTINFGPATFNGPNIMIQYNAGDMVKDIIKRINESGAGVVAYLNHRGEFTIKAKVPQDRRFEPFVIRHIEDSGNFLVGIAGILRASGPAGAYDWQNVGQINQFQAGAERISLTPQRHPASWIQVNPILHLDPDNIAAAGGRDANGDGIPDYTLGPGDNSNALLIAGLKHKDVMIDSHSNFEMFFKAMVGDVGTKAEASAVSIKKQELVLQNLKNLREEKSGVNIDEEVSKLLMYQHAYNAAARFITYMDRLLDTIINRMGV